jgi:hypothetical protein
VGLAKLEKMRLLAKANFYGNLMGCSNSVYYYYRIDAIIPTMIIISLSSFLFAFYFSKKIEIQKNNLTIKELLLEEKASSSCVLLTISGLLTLLSTYLIQIYVGKIGGLEEVGFILQVLHC